jgi:hypothetical protein
MLRKLFNDIAIKQQCFNFGWGVAFLYCEEYVVPKKGIDDIPLDQVKFNKGLQRL